MIVIESCKKEKKTVKSRLTIHLHKALKCIHRLPIMRTMLIKSRKSERLEMRAVQERLGNFRAERRGNIIVAPNLTILGVG